MIKQTKNITIGYLSSAPHISLYERAYGAGQRAHIKGFLAGLKKQRIAVKTWIAGDEITPFLSRYLVKTNATTIHGVPILSDMLRVCLRPIAQYAAWKKINKKVDFVYERLGVFQELGSRFKREGIPWILETNAPLALEGRGKTLFFTKLAKWFEARAYQQADLIVCVSEQLKQILIREYHLPKNKIIVIPNGVDTEQFKPDYSKKSKRFTIGYAGSLVKWQNLDAVCTALAALQAEGLTIGLDIIGEGRERKKLETKVKMLGLRHVRFLGQIPHAAIPGALQACDIGYAGYLPQYEKNIYFSSLKLYEYLALGKPVLATPLGDAGKYIQEGKNGFLFSPYNQESLKNAIKKAYYARSSFEKIGRRNRKSALHHDWKFLTAQLMKEIKKRGFL